MNMRMKMVVAAVTAALGMGAAQAVNLHQFAGEVLLVPYYTARNDQNTYLSIVNTTNETKAIKVRFLEGLNSREVLDFNLYMSPFDVWTAAVQPTGKGGAKIYTQDNSCTVPSIPAEGEPFRTFAFDGSLPEYDLDGGPTGLDRTMEGHIEIIEMGIADKANLGHWDSNQNDIPDSTHDETGYPEDCQSLYNNWKLGAWKKGNTNTLPPTGGLIGTASVISVKEGTQFDVPVSTLDDFSDVELHYSPGTLYPNLSEANPPASLTLTADNQLVLDLWGSGAEAVSAAMMTETLVQEYTVNPAVEAETAWIITMPTKHYHVDLGLAPLAPFTEYFRDGKSCDPTENHIFNREEELVDNEDNDFSPMPPGKYDELCYETNVVNWNDSDIFASTLLADTILTPYRNGWNTMSFIGKNNQMVSKRGNTYHGLPAIGFKAIRLMNSNVGVGAAYGAGSPHRYLRTISGTSGS